MKNCIQQVQQHLKIRSIEGLITITLLFVLSACALPDYLGWRSQVNRSITVIELRQNRERWAGRNIPNYRYALQIICFCPPEFRQAVVIEVRDNTMVSITSALDSTPVDSQGFEHTDTIDKLFGIIQEALDNEAYSIEAKYDPDFGYPRRIFIDYEERTADEEMGYEIINFEVIEE